MFRFLFCIILRWRLGFTSPYSVQKFLTTECEQAFSYLHPPFFNWYTGTLSKIDRLPLPTFFKGVPSLVSFQGEYFYLKNPPRTCKWLISMAIVSPLTGARFLFQNGLTSWLVNEGDRLRDLLRCTDEPEKNDCDSKLNGCC